MDLTRAMPHLALQGWWAHSGPTQPTPKQELALDHTRIHPSTPRFPEPLIPIAKSVCAPETKERACGEDARSEQ